MRVLCALLWVVCAPQTIHAQKTATDANITGHVIDASTKEHIPFATITLQGTTLGVATDGTGHFFMKNMPVGQFMLKVSSIGYKSIEIPVTIIARKSQEINIELDAEALAVDEVVVSASRSETNKKTSPTIVRSATTKLFDSTASTNLAESMNFQPGIRVENNCNNCGITQLRINGLDGQYSQVLLDSRPIFSSLATVYGLEQLPVAMVERVEVIRGGGSALFGSNAIGGVVNIITKEPLHNSLSLSNTTNVLEGGTTDINTSINGSFVSDDYKMGAYIFGMVKDRDSYDRNGDGFSDVPLLNSETVGFRAYYKTSPYSRITGEYHHITELRRGGNAFDQPPHMADIAEQLDSKIDGGGLKFDYFSPNGYHRMSAYTSAQKIDRTSYFGVEKDLNAYGATHDKTFVAGMQYIYSMDRLLFLPSDFTAGVEYTYNDLHDIYLGFGRDFKQSTDTKGLFMQNEWKSEKLNFLIGFRADKHNLVKDLVFSPRANVRYSPTENVGLRLSYSSGYRAPQAYNEDLHVDAVNNQMVIITLNPNLKPEYSHSLSASVDLYHSFGALQTNILFEGFYTDLDDVFTLEKIGVNSDGFIIKERRNATGATVKGISVEAKAGVADKFELQLGYTLQSSRYHQPERWSDAVEPQKRMFRSPDSYGYLTANANITQSLKASVFGNYTGSMLVQHCEGVIPQDEEKMTPDFWDLGFRLSQTFKLSALTQLELSAGVKNILDSYQDDIDYGQNKDAGYTYGPALPRMFFFGVKFSL